MSVTQISVPPSNATRLCTKIWWGAKKRNHKPRKNWEAVDFQKIQAMSIAINQHTNLEIGNHISWQTGRDWHPFQWNCSLMSGEPVLPKHHWSQQMSNLDGYRTHAKQQNWGNRRDLQDWTQLRSLGQLHPLLWHLPWPAPAVPSLKHSNLAPADNIQKTPGRSPNFNLHGY